MSNTKSWAKLHYSSDSRVKECIQVKKGGISNSEEINKAFDEGMIENSDFFFYLGIGNALSTIAKAYAQDKVTLNQFMDAFEKSKHYEFVKVVRDGKQFFQYKKIEYSKGS